MSEKTQKEIQKSYRTMLKAAADMGETYAELYKTTLKRYINQLKIAAQLEDELDKIVENGEITVIKEYVKGRKNVCSNPVFKDYNQTVSGANKTAESLLRILSAAGADHETVEKGKESLIGFVASRKD